MGSGRAAPGRLLRRGPARCGLFAPGCGRRSRAAVAAVTATGVTGRMARRMSGSMAGAVGCAVSRAVGRPVRAAVSRAVSTGVAGCVRATVSCAVAARRGYGGLLVRLGGLRSCCAAARSWRGRSFAVRVDGGCLAGRCGLRLLACHGVYRLPGFCGDPGQSAGKSRRVGQRCPDNAVLTAGSGDSRYCVREVVMEKSISLPRIVLPVPVFKATCALTAGGCPT